MKNILVTGSNGFVASRFIEFYKDKYQIFSLNKHELDITNEKQVYELFKENTFDIVFHPAAISDTQYCENNPTSAHLINTQGTINIAKGCELNGSKLIFTSSDQVYNGNVEEGPYSEDTLINPVSVYGNSKLNAEKEIKNILDTYYNLRLTWLFSLPERNKKVNTNIITSIINTTLKNTPINLSNNEFRGMTYVYELIENIEPLLNCPYGDYNFGSENNLSTYDIGVKVLKSLNLSNRIEDIIIKDTEKFKYNPRDLRICTNKLKENSIIFDNTDIAIERCINEFIK